jgi:hypothetical protein
MQHGGEKILNQLNDDSASSSENEVTSPKIKGLPLAQVKEESISEKNVTPVEDPYKSELFGPMTSFLNIE